MKYFISASQTVGLLFVLLALASCKPEYTIETVVEIADPQANTASMKQRLATELEARLDRTFGETASLENTDSGFRILTSHTGQPTAEMGKLIGATGSAKFEIYDLFRAMDPELGEYVEGVEWADFKAERNRGLMGETIIAGLDKLGRVDDLLAELNQDAPENIRFVSGPNITSSRLKPGDIHHLIYAKKIPANGQAPINYENVVEAEVQPDGAGQIGVVIKMNETGARVWADMTTKAFRDGNRAVGILINDEVFSAPFVQSPITGGMTMLSSFRSAEQAQNLATQIPLGPLPLRLKVISQRVVE